MESHEEKLNRNSALIKREFTRALIPVMLSVLGGTINTLIDSAFVTRRLDAKALVAVDLNLPIFLMLCTVGCLISGGAFVAIARAIGKNDNEAAGKYYHSAIFYSLVISLIFTLVGIFGTDAIAGILCKDSEILPLVHTYCGITLIGAVVYIMIYIPSFCLQLSGMEKSMTVMMVIMIATDVIFDWVLLYVFDLGIAGAGYASIISMLLACGYGFYKLQSTKGIFHMRLRNLKPFGFIYILIYGSTQALGTLFNAVRIFVLNVIIFKAGGSEALAVWAVLCVIIEISLCITSGVPRTAAPLLGIYAGGYDNESIRMLVRHQIKMGLGLMAVYISLATIFNVPIARFYKLDSNLMTPIICLGISLLFEVLCSILLSYYNVLNKVLLSNLIMFMRILGYAALFAFIMYAAGIYIWLFLPLSMIATLATTLLISHIRSKHTRGTAAELSGVLLLDDAFQRSNKIKTFSVVSSDEEICRASEGIVEFCLRNNMDTKSATRLGLAMEEVLTVIARKSLKNENDLVDARIYSYDDKIGLTIMCAGNEYDLFKEAENDEDDFTMGVRLIQRLSKKCSYIYTLGLNVLTVEF